MAKPDEKYLKVKKVKFYKLNQNALFQNRMTKTFKLKMPVMRQ